MLALVAAGPLEAAVTLPGTLAPVGLTRVATFYAVVAVLGHALLTRHRFRGDQTYLLGLGLGCLALLSAAASSDPASSLAVAGRLVGAVVLLVTVGEFGAGRVRTVLWAWTTVTAAVTVPALAMFVTGETTLLRTDTADPNDFAVLMAVALPMAVYLGGRATTSARARTVALVCVGLLAVSVLLTLSRGAVVALAAGAGWHLATEPRHRRGLVALLAGGLGVVVVAGLALLPLVTEALTRKEVIASYNVTSRLSGWRLALELSQDNPLLGIGPGMFGTFYRDGTDTPAGAFALAVTHNTYLGVLAEMGLPALLVLLAVLGTSWARLSALRTDPALPDPLQGAAAAVRTSLLVAVIAVTFTNQEYSPPLWLLAGLAVALAARRPQADARDPGEPTGGCC